MAESIPTQPDPGHEDDHHHGEQSFVSKYLLSTDHKVIARFEPVVRYGEFRITGLEELAEEAAEERLDIGLNYWIAPSIVARGVAQFRDFTARHDDEPDSETRFLLQLAYGF